MSEPIANDFASIAEAIKRIKREEGREGDVRPQSDQASDKPDFYVDLYNA